MELCFLMGVGAAGDDNPPRYRRGDHGVSAIAMQAYTLMEARNRSLGRASIARPYGTMDGRPCGACVVQAF